MIEKIKKVVLAYSGGLDTSVILRWLIETYDCEVVTFSADIGQVDSLENVEANAMKTGACKAYVDDLKETFVKDYVFPAFRANVIYEGQYLLGTSNIRIAARQVGRGDDLAMHRIWAKTIAENTGSMRVLEKLGMRLEAHEREKEWIKGRWHDRLTFAILDHEWQAGQKPSRSLP